MPGGGELRQKRSALERTRIFWHLSGFTLYLYLLTGILCERWKGGNVHLSCRSIISQIRSTGNARLSQYRCPSCPLIGCIPCMTGIPGMLCIGPGVRFVAQYGQNFQRNSSNRSHLGQAAFSF